MATKKAPATKAKVAPKKTAAAKPAAKKPAAKPAEMKPIKTAFTKASLIAHLAEQACVEPKAAKAVLAALEATALASVSKKGLGEFMLPGLLKVVAQKVPAKAKRFGKNPFTGQEQWFAAKPATIKVKVRPMKKLKDAAL
jgi:nucleoid DNA-binding protein